MANDSGTCSRLPKSLQQGARISTAWAWARDSERWLPLYEAKMLSHWDHRYATYEGATQAQLNKGTPPRLYATPSTTTPK